MATEKFWSKNNDFRALVKCWTRLFQLKNAHSHWEDGLPASLNRSLDKWCANIRPPMADPTLRGNLEAIMKTTKTMVCAALLEHLTTSIVTTMEAKKKLSHEDEDVASHKAWKLVSKSIPKLHRGMLEAAGMEQNVTPRRPTGARRKNRPGPPPSRDVQNEGRRTPTPPTDQRHKPGTRSTPTPSTERQQSNGTGAPPSVSKKHAGRNPTTPAAPSVQQSSNATEAPPTEPKNYTRSNGTRAPPNETTNDPGANKATTTPTPPSVQQRTTTTAAPPTVSKYNTRSTGAPPTEHQRSNGTRAPPSETTNIAGRTATTTTPTPPSELQCSNANTAPSTEPRNIAKVPERGRKIGSRRTANSRAATSGTTTCRPEAR